MRVFPALLLALQISSSSVEAQVIGDLRLEELRSEVFGNTRTLRVLLPPGYDQPANRDRRYPVLYLNDGQNLFDSATAIFNPMEWRVDETVDSLVRAGAIPSLIVVGIDNAGRRGRAHEYLPYPDEYLSPPEPDPQGRRYPGFLADEVIPFVNSRYRTLTGPENTALGGSSYGALIATYSVIARPGVFGLLLVESPSFYVDSSRILTEAALARAWPSRVFLGVGTNEGGQQSCDPHEPVTPEIVQEVERLQGIITTAQPSSLVEILVAPCAVHNEAAWAARLPAALGFLYRR